jgi:fatty acid CoA ligase FadD28
MRDFSVSAVVRERASLQPNDVAFTYIDYEHDWDGVAETLTWLQLYRRIQSLAHRLRFAGATGDRAVIVAPQGLDYVVAFLGAMEAGRIAVPLSLPMGGATDARVTSVLENSSPSTVLTTSAVASIVADHIQPRPGETPPTLIEVDLVETERGQRRRVHENGHPEVSYLQYTSGSTRAPKGVMVTNQNIRANYEQIVAAYFPGNVIPQETTFVSWCPLYHDMGLFGGLLLPILSGRPCVLFSPATFLQRPARWMQLLASNPGAFSSGPNFAFELAVKRTTDEDMAGLDLGSVHALLSGSERVQPATLRRFSEKFARFGLRPSSLRPSYGMAEAAVYLATRTPAKPPEVVYFESDQLSAGDAKRCGVSGGTPLVSYGMPESPIIRIVDPETCIECPPGSVGEVWSQGDNVAIGYWELADDSEHAFGGQIVEPAAGTPDGTWLRTGDLGFVSENELFIIGRIKDLLIVYGRNHSPDDIEATIHEITRGRCAAISVSGDRSEQLVAIIEVKSPGQSYEDAAEALGMVKREVTSAISSSHGLRVADLVIVPPGSIPTTTSGKVRRSACAEQYRHGRFARLDA